MSEQFIKMPVDVLLFGNLSPLEIAVFLHLRYEIMTQGNNLKIQPREEDKYCCKPSGVMAARVGVGRAAYIKALHSLEKINLIQIEPQKNGSQSNHIFITLNRCMEFLQNGGSAKDPQVYLNDTPEVYLKDSEVYLKDSEVYLKDSGVYLKDTPYIDKEFKNLNLKNLNGKNDEVYLKDTPKKETKANNHIATGDVAPVRSMPNEESARNEVAARQCELEDYLLVESFFDVFSGLKPWVEFVKSGNEIILRPAGRGGMFSKKIAENRVEIEKFFAEKKQKITVFSQKTRKIGEIIINCSAKTAV